MPGQDDCTFQKQGARSAPVFGSVVGYIYIYVNALPLTVHYCPADRTFNVSYLVLLCLRFFKKNRCGVWRRGFVVPFAGVAIPFGRSRFLSRSTRFSGCNFAASGRAIG